MSDISKAVEEYLSTRRALGFQLNYAALMLRDFARFVAEQNSAHLTAELAVKWACTPAHAQPCQWSRRLGVIRRFARYHSASDPRTEIPAKALLPFPYVRKDPYIYTARDIAALTQAARELPCRRGIVPQTYSTLIPLLAVTGLRVGEAIGLDRCDFDRRDGTLLVRQTKFRKSRLVPIHPSTAAAIEAYCTRTKTIFPRVTSLFISARGKRLDPSTLFANFRLLLARCGLPPPGDSRRARPHGLRHTFAVDTLLRWYRHGVDVERQLPLLATYLGHTRVTNTYWYLSATPELLALAAERLDSPLWRMRS
jgi:integrase/recombinase XerD